jgi:hypothetical protein
MQCNGVDGWLVGWELVLGWENAEAEAKKESTNRLTAPYGDETCFGDVGVVVCFFVQGKSAEHGTEVCTTLEVWTNCLQYSRCLQYRRQLLASLARINVIAAPRVFRRGKTMEKKWAL